MLAELPRSTPEEMTGLPGMSSTSTRCVLSSGSRLNALPYLVLDLVSNGFSDFGEADTRLFSICHVALSLSLHRSQVGLPSRTWQADVETARSENDKHIHSAVDEIDAAFLLLLPLEAVVEACVTVVRGV